jgi:hypothetical protein
MRDVNYRRRRFLQRGVAVGSVFLSVPYAWVWAQSDGVLKLLRLPKVALVVGNSAYKKARATGGVASLDVLCGTSWCN